MRQGPVLRLLEDLARRAGLRRAPTLSVHAACPTPMAWSSTEICVPPRFFSELSGDEQQAALAHELAHVVRRDPLWHGLGSLIQRVFFFQPLNRLGFARWQEAAEYRCDAWAVRQTGDSLSLARCLTSVGSWVVESPASGSPGPVAMLQRRSPLVSRIARLTRERPESWVTTRWTFVVAIGCAMATFVMAAPAVRLTSGTHRADYEWSARLDAGALLEIKAVTGNIRVTRSSDDRFVVHAVAEGTDSDRIRYEAVEHQGGVTLCSVFPAAPGKPANVCEPGRWRIHGSTARARVDFEIEVPGEARVIARTMTGDIVVEHPGAEVVARTTTGNVAVVLDDPAWSGRIDVANTTGDIAVWIPPDASLRLRARSERSRVTTEIPVDDLPVPRPSPQVLEGETGGASPTGAIVVSSVWGDIEFRDGSGRQSIFAAGSPGPLPSWKTTIPVTRPEPSVSKRKVVVWPS